MPAHATKPHGGGQPSEPQRPSIEELQREARVYEERHAGTVLAALGTKLGKHVTPGGFAVYLQNVLAKAVDPTDPLERMLIEELVWLHQRIGDLHMSAADAATPELVNVLNAAVTKLAAEFRKSVLALREYRNPLPPQQLTLIKQQNVVGRDQQIALVEPAAPVAPLGNEIFDSEVGGSDPHKLAHEVQQFTAESEADSRRPAEPKEKSRPDTRGETSPLRKLFARKPWLFSTGPRTARGKATAALNGKARQKGPMSVRELRAFMADVRGMIDSMAVLRQAASRAVQHRDECISTPDQD